MRLQRCVDSEIGKRIRQVSLGGLLSAMQCGRTSANRNRLEATSRALRRRLSHGLHRRNVTSSEAHYDDGGGESRFAAFDGRVLSGTRDWRRGKQLAQRAWGTVS